MADPIKTEQDAWIEVAVKSNRAVDAYLHDVDPSLPEHYGMPVDGIRRVVTTLWRERDELRQRAEAAESLVRQYELVIDGIRRVVTTLWRERDELRQRAEAAESLVRQYELVIDPGELTMAQCIERLERMVRDTLHILTETMESSNRAVLARTLGWARSRLKGTCEQPSHTESPPHRRGEPFQ